MKTKTASNAEYRAAAALLLLASSALHLGRCSASKADAASIVTGYTSEEDLMKLFAGLSEKNSPEIFLDMNVETTADFLNMTRQAAGEATLAQFLDVKGDASGVASASAITRENVQSCAPDENVFAVLKAREGNLGLYDFGLTVSALESTGISNLLEVAPEGEDFKAYALVAPTDDAWRKLKQRLQNEPSTSSEALPLQSLLTYQVYGENNETNFNAIKDVINGTFLEDAPFSFFINVPIDMLDGNATVLSVGSAETVPPELNGSPILAIEAACNGVIIVLDDVLLPGAAVEEYMKPPQDAGEAAVAGKAAAAAADDHGDTCTDAVPPAPLGTQWTCEDQKYWGKCQQYWMWAGDYCRKTCEYCGKADFPYGRASGASASSPTASGEQPSSEAPRDPCGCTPDGLSGSVFTGVSGCATMTVPQLMGMAYANSVSDSAVAVNVGRELGSRFDWIPGTQEFNYCYVNNPSSCKQYTEPSPFFEGVRWRFC